MPRKATTSKPVSVAETSEERIQAFKDAHRTFFWEPYPWQQRLLKMVREKSTIAAVSSNKIGKSCAVINILISWALGYEPWCPVVPEHPLAVEVPGRSSTRPRHLV